MFPEFKGSVVFFNLFNPLKMTKDNDLFLHVRVFNKGGFSNDLLGECSLSILPFFEGLESEKEWYDLTWLHKKTGQERPAGELQLEVQFQPVLQGLIVVTAYDGLCKRTAGWS